MTDRDAYRRLFALLMELPRETREEIVVEELELAAGHEPDGDTERANWYRAAFQRLVKRNAGAIRRAVHDGPTFEDVLERVREEVEARRTSPEDVGVRVG